MYGNQIARNSQVQAARARLAARQGYNVPGGAYDANMAACGPVVPAIGGNPVGVTPALPGGYWPGAGYGPGVYQLPCVPCMVIMQADLGASTQAEIATTGGRLFQACGISSLNSPFEVMISSIFAGSGQVNLLPCGDVDPAIWNTDDCFCCFGCFCVSTIAPATITFSNFGTPSVGNFLSLAFWGTSLQGGNDCGYPYGLPPNGFFPFAGGGHVGGVDTRLTGGQVPLPYGAGYGGYGGFGGYGVPVAGPANGGMGGGNGM